ncbi:MAG TPA: MarR family transcriptional regulator [Pseudolysinimonas sp.]|nr:MarR family transcriptional regulator [Pseudolysinimonas sp.]
MADSDTGDAALDSLSVVSRAVELTVERIPDTDADAMRAVLLLHRVVNVLSYDLESSVHRPRGWSWPAFRLLFTIWVSGKQESKNVAALSGMSRAAVSSLTNTLEPMGLLTREVDPTDKRKMLLALTPQGSAELETALKANNQRESMWAGALSPAELGGLGTALEKLASVAQSEWVNKRD